MVRMTVTEMNTKLVELNIFFANKTKQFTNQISIHQGRLTQQDFNDFQSLINQIKTEASEKIQNFINIRFQQRSEVYQNQISSYSKANYEVQNELKEFSNYLQRCTIELKTQQNANENLLERISKKYAKKLTMSKAFKLLNDYRLQRQNEKQLNQKMDAVYKKNLLKKAFFPWRTLSYKEGYQNTVRRETETDIMNIHQQYKSIIQILKTKINETGNLIKVKKAAKGQFTYALNKNLLKTISNLSLEVMSLNQISLRDQQFGNQSTQKFMENVDVIIKEKLEKVREYKREISGENAENQGTRRKKITFL